MKSRFFLILFTALILLGCSKESNEDELSSFNFEVNVHSITDRSATISWTAPQGPNIVYKVFLNNEVIVDNLTQTAYTVFGLSGETDYEGKITASSGSNSKTVNFSFRTPQYVPNIYEGAVFLKNQQEVNEFGSHHYTEIRNQLTIQGNTIYDLSPLADLKIVHDNVSIKSIITENMLGLESLNLIEGKLYLYDNRNLKDLKGLESLTKINGNIELYSNWLLEDIDALKNVVGFTGGLQIERSNISEIAIFEDSVKLENLYLGSNSQLQSISGLRNITEIADFLDFDGSPLLTNLNALNSIKQVGGDVYITSPVISDLGLVNLESVGGRLDIFFLPGIINLDDLSNLQHFGNLEIWANENLSDLCGITTAVLNMNMPIEISGNLFNPTLADFRNGNCSL